MINASQTCSGHQRFCAPAGHRDLEALREAISSRYGFCIKESSIGMLAARVNTRAAAAGVSASEYALSLLAPPGNEQEFSLLAESILIGETHFLRTEPHFAALAGIVIATWRGTKAPKQRLRIVSLGCSTGEEPYSIAIVLREHLLPNEIEEVEITGVDASRNALALAREGLYDPFQLRDLSESRRHRWFSKEGNAWRIHPCLRESVRFLQHNILHPLPFAGLDLVFCRNVLIYFSHACVASCLSEIHASLRHGGFLILGHSESGFGYPDLFEPTSVPDGVIYRKRSTSCPIS